MSFALSLCSRDGYLYSMIRFTGAAGLIWLLCSLVASGEPPRGHWAFQPLGEAAPPEISDRWIQTPVDAFVLRKLREGQLEPAPPATRREFIRRAHVTLTGLPPDYPNLVEWLADDVTPDEAFAADLVERLLASPQFGVRWGRYWLDVARYSDTKGYAYGNEQPDFFHAWRYRDWVVEAFNRDLPYNRFIERQIAADRLLEEGLCETGDLAAMGFLTMGRRFLGVEQDIVDDRIDVVTRGLLGLTVACARCHDHKFDPIPTADYYALYGIFKSSRERVAPLNQEPPNDPELEKLWQEFKTVFDTNADAAEESFLERADEYLVASLDPSTVPPPAFSEIVTPDAVIPAQIRRWHEYLSRSDKDHHPVFAPWKALAKAEPTHYSSVLAVCSNESNPIVIDWLLKELPESMEGVARRYAHLFREAMAGPHPNAAWYGIRSTMLAPDSPFVIAREHPHDVEWLFHNEGQNAIKKAFANLERRLAALRENAAYTVALEDRPVPQNMRILRRGDYRNQGNEVPRANLSVLGESPRVNSGSGRMELARAIADPANPLTARVMVNRIWHHYFGTGLVSTNSDFGLRAEPPSHPELLDYLARELIESGWSLKSIHRLIATSSTFRQRAGQAGDADPENRLLSHFPRQRLDFESMRDGLLVAAGEIDLQLDGPPGPLLGDNPSPRRSIYGKVDRKFLPTELRVFDFANPELHSPKRYETNVPQQALFFLNSRFTIDRARALAKRVDQNSPETGVHELFQIVYQRNSTPEQLTASLDFLQTPAIEQPPTALTNWERLAHALLLSNEFIFVD
jgi:hypothetical protein